jgi:hypothetical protein
MKDLLARGVQPTFGYLLPVVRAKGTIIYGEIADRLASDLGITGKVFPTQIGAVVGHLTERLLAIEPTVPLINVLVVSQTNDQPSSGADHFLRQKFRLGEESIADPVRRALVAKAASEAYAYPRWRKLYEQLFAAPPPSDEPVTLIGATEADGLPPLIARSAQAYGGPAESAAHKNLKAYVLAHPKSVGAPARPEAAQVELMLHSGDEVDVYFAQDTRIHLVEVKSILSSDQDLRRGIYQCIKYRAVYQAQCKGVTPDITIVATLVMEREPPSFIKALAALHQIRIVILRVTP